MKFELDYKNSNIKLLNKYNILKVNINKPGPTKKWIERKSTEQEEFLEMLNSTK